MDWFALTHFERVGYRVAFGSPGLAEHAVPSIVPAGGAQPLDRRDLMMIVDPNGSSTLMLVYSLSTRPAGESGQPGLFFIVGMQFEKLPTAQSLRAAVEAAISTLETRMVLPHARGRFGIARVSALVEWLAPLAARSELSSFEVDHARLQVADALEHIPWVESAAAGVSGRKPVPLGPMSRGSVVRGASDREFVLNAAEAVQHVAAQVLETGHARSPVAITTRDLVAQHGFIRVYRIVPRSRRPVSVRQAPLYTPPTGEPVGDGGREAGAAVRPRKQMRRVGAASHRSRWNPLSWASGLFGGLWRFLTGTRDPLDLE